MSEQLIEDSILETEKQENVEYIEPNIEAFLDKEKKLECRHIVRQINNFKFSERQKLFLIHLLSLELEKQDNVKIVAEAVKKVRSNFDKQEIVKEEKQKLVLDNQTTAKKKLIY